jgi:hypothetical protein
VEIIPPQCSPEIVPPHATLLENLPPQTAQVSPEIIPSDEAAILETPDGLHPNQYATRLLEEIRFPVVPDRVHAVAAAIEREAKTMGLVGAYGFLVERTKFAIFEEHEINTSFFSESRYRPEQRNDNGRQVSTQAKRTSNTQRNDAFADDSNPDSRHAPIRELVQQMHLKKFRVKCQWDGSEGKALDRLLSANPSWSEEELARMVSNRFDSEGIAPDRPRKWLSNLGSYAAGAQDRYNKLKGSGTNGNGKPSVGQIVEREIAILHARRAQ